MGYKWRSSAQNKYSIVISAKNQEDTIGVCGGFILKAGIEGQEEALLNVVLVDADSPMILPGHEEAGRGVLLCEIRYLSGAACLS